MTTVLIILASLAAGALIGIFAASLAVTARRADMWRRPR